VARTESITSHKRRSAAPHIQANAPLNGGDYLSTFAVLVRR